MKLPFDKQDMTRFIVNSNTSDKEYNVLYHEGKGVVSCECAGYANRKNCFHAKMVTLFMDLQDVAIPDKLAVVISDARAKGDYKSIYGILKSVKKKVEQGKMKRTEITSDMLNNIFKE